MAPTAPASPPAERAGERPRRRPAPLNAYFDTSALIKLLLEETGSELADEVWARASVRIASRLVYPEARAALAAANRAGRLDSRGRRAATGELTAACSALQLIGVDWDLALVAGDLAESHRLRGYDAVHLATAVAGLGPDGLLVTWDRELARAAAEAGLAVTPPPEHY